MTDVLVLGSGTSNPDPGRGGSGVAVVADISDLATLATARWTVGASSPMTVLALSGPVVSFAQHCLDVFDDQSFFGQAPNAAGTRPCIDAQEFPASNHVSLVHATAGWRISGVLVDHHPVAPAVGYLVEHGGHRVAVSGNTAVCDGVRTLSQGVDVLVHEALLSSRVSAGLLAWNAGARSVGELAADAVPRQLVLTHLLPAPRSDEDELAYVNEVRAGGYDGPVIVARDLLRIAVEPA